VIAEIISPFIGLVRAN